MKNKLNSNMKIGIIEIKEDLFTYTWKNYCEKNKISYLLIKKINYDIFSSFKNLDVILWHWNLADFENYDIARQLLTSLDQYTNLRIFPNFNTVWHYDDKLIQSILLEIKKIPQPNFWFFFNKNDALKWIKNVKYPIIFKLRKGAGSNNVKFISNMKQAKKVINKMFNKGIKPVSLGIKDKIKKKDFTKIIKFGLKKGLSLYFKVNKISRERGYVYFQEFIPDCKMDYRVTVINHKAYVYNRFMRKNDFRASGSGKFTIDHKKIDTQCIKIAFKTSKILKLQSCAFDFLKSENGFKIIEISYDFIPTVGTFNGKWHGYWDENLNYFEKEVDPVELMIESAIFNQ